MDTRFTPATWNARSRRSRRSKALFCCAPSQKYSVYYTSAALSFWKTTLHAERWVVFLNLRCPITLFHHQFHLVIHEQISEMDSHTYSAFWPPRPLSQTGICGRRRCCPKTFDESPEIGALRKNPQKSGDPRRPPPPPSRKCWGGNIGFLPTPIESTDIVSVLHTVSWALMKDNDVLKRLMSYTLACEKQRFVFSVWLICTHMFDDFVAPAPYNALTHSHGHVS